MKTMKKMLVLVILFTMATGYATGNDVHAPNKVTTIVKFSNVKKGHEYTIKNSQGVIIFSDMIEKEGTFAKKFDFTDMEDGFYTFEISKDFEIIITPFEILSHRVKFLDDQMTKKFKPVVRLKNDVLIISQLNLVDDASMKVQLYYEGEVIHNETLKGGQVLESILKLSKNEKGAYNLIITSGGQNFFQTFEL